MPCVCRLRQIFPLNFLFLIYNAVFGIVDDKLAQHAGVVIIRPLRGDI